MTHFKVSHSKMATFRRCLQQYHWKYKDKYYPPSSKGQLRGTCGHIALGVWHQEFDASKATQAAWDHWAGYYSNPDEEWEILERALGRYYTWDAQETNARIHLEEAEYEFEITYRVGNDSTPVTFMGFIDGIVKQNDAYWLLENKFYKRMVSVNSLDMDQQVSLYMLAAQTLDYPVVGVIYNMVRVADTKVAETEPVVRKKLYRNPMGLSKVQSEMVQQIETMLHYEKGGMPFRNPTKDCSWDCSFYSACLSMGEDGQEPTEILEQITMTRKE